MRFDVGGINHEPLKVWLVEHNFEQSLPNSLVAPAAKPTMGIFPIAKFGWQVPPGRTRTQNPDHGIDELAIIFGDATPIPLFPGKMGTDYFPRAFTDVVTMQGVFHEYPPRQLIPERIRKAPLIINTRDDSP